MSHDIRTPMNAILGMTAVAGMHIDEKERVIDALGNTTQSLRRDPSAYTGTLRNPPSPAALIYWTASETLPAAEGIPPR